MRKWLAAVMIQLCFCAVGLAQTVSPGAPGFLWARQIGQGGQDLGSSIAVDPEGNAYVGAMFSSSSIDLGGTILTNRGGFDGFLAKYDRNGNLVWVRQAGGSQGDEIKSVALDGSGNIYAAGSSSSTDGTIAGTAIGNDGGQDFFVAKFSSAGDVIWVRHGAGAESESTSRVAVDPAGNCFLVGYFYGTNLVFGNTILSNRMNGCSADIFLAKYSPDGAFQWVQQFGTACLIPGLCVTADPQGNCYVGGSFTDSAPFGSTNLQALAGYNAFVAKYAPDGQIIWARQLAEDETAAEAAGHYNYTTDIKLDRDGNIFVAGVFETPVARFDSYSLTNAGTADMFPKADPFLAKLNFAGEVLWVNGGGGIRDDGSQSIAVDPFGNSYLTLQWESPTLTFAGLTFTNTSVSSDMLFCEYDSKGNLVWIRQTRGNSEEYGYIAVDPVGNLYTTGAFRSIDLQLGKFILNAQGAYHIIVAKLDTTMRPSLAPVRTQSSLLLSWNPLFSGFHLESSDECCNPAAWVFYSTSSSINLETNTVEVPLTGSPHYFRLAKP